MSPARKHRDRFAALAAAGEPAPESVPEQEGGQPTESAIVIDTSPMTPAKAHRLRTAGAVIVIGEMSDEDRAHLEAALSKPGPPIVSADNASAVIVANASPLVEQLKLRLIHDLRTLKDIKSIERKIEAKRGMLPEYAPYIEGVLAAHAGGRDDVVATVAIWRIDIGDYAGALPVIAYILAHEVDLPSRYARDAASLFVEEIATAALAARSAGRAFDLAILEAIEALTADADMHDEIRAKLEKAIGVELLAVAETIAPGDANFLPAHQAALAVLQRAQGHHDRVGVKDRIKRAEKAIAAIAGPDATESGCNAA